MKKLTNLNRDARPVNVPEGAYPFGKNGILNYIQKSIINEPGFTESEAVIPYQVIGIIETDKYPVIISTNNTNTAFGYFNVDTDSYDAICNDATLPFKFNFNVNRFVTGQAQRNYKGEVVIAVTDGEQTPYYLNCDSFGSPVGVDEVRLFPSSQRPVITTQLESGGALLPGAYYIALHYIARDGTETGIVSITAPEIVLGTTGEATDRAIEIALSQLDPKYDRVQLSIISKISGKVSAVRLITPLSVTTTGNYVYTGTEVTEDVTLEELLIPPAVYAKVKVMGQLNDALYLGDLTVPPKVNMQKWVNLMRLKWHSTLVNVIPQYEPMVTGKEKSFMHKEVYAFYIRFSLSRGGYSEFFHIPNHAPAAGDETQSTLATAENITGKKFQIEDTIPVFDASSRSGQFGTWVNDDETYPNTADYDSSALGGEDLRGEKVRHHRCPSIRWCKQNLYSGEPNYGRNSLDMLGVSVENIIIPAEYASEINGWELYYAKRSVNNSTVLGQSLLLFGARDQFTTEGNPATYFSTGGNFNSRILFKSTPQRPLYMDQSIYHFHAFDILLNRPSAEPSFLSLELKERRTRIPYTDGYVEDGAIGGRNDGPLVYKLDYILKGDIPTVPATWMKAVIDTDYRPNDSQVGKWNNLWIEEFLGGTLKNYQKLIPDVEVSMQNVLPGSVSGYTTRGNAAQMETTFLANLMMIRSNVFVPFTGQSLVRAASSNTIINNSVFYHGDTYISDYTFHTYGRWASSGNDDIGGGPEICGTKVARRFVCETASNLNGRFEIEGNQYSKYYPKSPLQDNDVNANYLIQFSRKEDPNQFGYSKDSNAQDDLISSDIFNTFAEQITEFPFRIHRTGKLSRQTKGRNWKTVLPLDYYEGQKNMGRIVNLEGMDDRLLIQYENSLMITQDKAKLESDIIAVTLGSGDIFQFQPQEALSAKLGYGGTLHRLACVRTPYGYLFADTKEGAMFLWKGSLEQLNNSLNTHFRDFLKLTDNNVFTGNGITIGYDQKYKRFLLTVKNEENVAVYAGPVGGNGVYEDSWIPSLTIGDIVYKNGMYQEFLGVNATAYNCAGAIVPVVNDLVIDIASDTPVGTVIGTLTGINVANFYLNIPLIGFTVTPSTGVITVTGSLSVYFPGDDLSAIAASTVRGESSDGSIDTGSLAINITRQVGGPVIGTNDFTIPDDVVNTDVVGTISASDLPTSLPLEFTVLNGNEAGAFAVGLASGQITIADETKIDATQQTLFTLNVEVKNALEFTSNAPVTINVIPADDTGGGTVEDRTVTVFDDIATGARVLKEIEYGIESSLPMSYIIVSQSPANKFEIDATTKDLKTTGSLDLGTDEDAEYTIAMQATDGVQVYTFNIIVTVWHDKSSIDFSPSATGYICALTDVTWTQVDITKTGVGLIVSKTNSAIPVQWQGMDLPYYAPLANSTVCGGANSLYLSTAQDSVVSKNDCIGTLGIPFTFTVPAGFIGSTVDVPTADAAALAFGDSIKQAFANSYGQCT